MKTSHEVIPDDLQACHRLKKKKGDCDYKIPIQETETKNPYSQEKSSQQIRKP